MSNIGKVNQVDDLLNKILDFNQNMDIELERNEINSLYSVLKYFIEAKDTQSLEKKQNYLADVANILLYSDFMSYKKCFAILVAYYNNSNINEEFEYLKNKQYIFNTFNEILKLNEADLVKVEELLEKRHLEDIRLDICNNSQYQIYFKVLENENFSSILQAVSQEYYIIKEYKVDRIFDFKNELEKPEKANYYLTNEKGDIYSNQRLKGQNFYNLLNDCVEIGKCNDFREILNLKGLNQFLPKKTIDKVKDNSSDLLEVSKEKMKDLIRQQIEQLKIMADNINLEDKRQIKRYLTKFYRYLGENGLAFKYLDLDLLSFLDNDCYIDFAQKAVSNNGLALKYVDIKRLENLDDYYFLCQIAINQNYRAFEYIEWDKIKQIDNDENLSLWYEKFANQVIKQSPMELKHIKFVYFLDLENPQQSYFDLCKKACLANKKALNFIRWEVLTNLGPSYLLKDIILGKLNQSQLDLF